MEENKQPENAQQGNMSYELTEQLVAAIRKYLGTKPFAEIADVIQLIMRTRIITEEEINIVLNRIGKYPYDDLRTIRPLPNDGRTEHISPVNGRFPGVEFWRQPASIAVERGMEA